MRYSDEMYVRRIGGCDVRCVKVGENEVWRRRESRGDGWRMWRVREDGSLIELVKGTVRVKKRTWSGFYES